MFFYSSSSKFRHRLSFCNLANNLQWLEQAAIWAENKWGYLRQFPGVEARKELIRSKAAHFYIVTYGKHAVGMFALIDLILLNNTQAQELMYFYVDSQFRNMGIGSRMLDIAKRISNRMENDMLVFDTLNPNLNKFYEKHGAQIVCENHLLGHATTVLRI